MAFAVAHAPPGWQRPGPTALWFSVAGGLVVGGIAVVHRVTRRWLVFLVAFLIIALSIGGMTGERYRLYVKSLKGEYLGNSAPTSPDDMANAISHGHIMEELIGDLREKRREIYEARRPFHVFLAFRLQGFGIDAEPWAAAFWLGEIFLGGLLGAFTATRWHKWQTEAQVSSAP
jgi:hypothetical protein